MFGISAIPAILLALGMSFCPESPQWLFQVSLLNCIIPSFESLCIFLFAMPSSAVILISYLL